MMIPSLISSRTVRADMLRFSVMVVIAVISSQPSDAAAQSTTDPLPPPGCLCTMAQCCDEASRSMWDCALFLSHVVLLTGGMDDNGSSDVDAVCQPYLDGTREADTTVCDAILNDAKFQDRFLSNDGDTSFWSSKVIVSSTSENVTCSDLTVDACPRLQPRNNSTTATSWTSVDPIHCRIQSQSKESWGFRSVQQIGCNEDEELDIFEGAVDPSATFDSPCPSTVTLVFSGTTAKGVDRKRWMCHEQNILSQGGNTSATIRSVYVNLGTLPCLGRTSEPTGAPTALTDAPTSSARQGISTLTSSLFGLLWILATGLCYSMEFIP